MKEANTVLVDLLSFGIHPHITIPYLFHTMYDTHSPLQLQTNNTPLLPGTPSLQIGPWAPQTHLDTHCFPVSNILCKPEIGHLTAANTFAKYLDPLARAQQQYGKITA